MRLVKRLIELAFVILIISLFMKNKDLELPINYFGLAQPLTVGFWELVTFCVSIGIIIALLGDFITQLKWIGEKRRMIKTDREHQGEVGRLNGRIQTLESENRLLKQNLDQKSKEVSEVQKRLDTLSYERREASHPDSEQPAGAAETK
jgi:ABC-type multidrug transport system fused ATPase/permease subunit